ncbi:MAG: hypothetical protein JSV68_04270 [Anaerolineaceae bacterium]|nr:MAG: hypothetical protein JSV68_04270 [Anaerolineaceae bacterium]
MTADDSEINSGGEVSSTDLHSSTYNLFILVLTIFSLLIMLLLLLPALSPPTKRTLQFIDTLICLIFLGDFFLSLARAPSNRVYFFKQGDGWNYWGVFRRYPVYPGRRCCGWPGWVAWRGSSAFYAPKIVKRYGQIFRPTGRRARCW